MIYYDSSVNVAFPGLHFSVPVRAEAFTIGPVSIRWYGILIAIGLCLAPVYGLRRAKDFGVTQDDLTDVVLFGVIGGIIGARIYYTLFNADAWSQFLSKPYTIFMIWEGGLAIYGGIIGAFVAALITAHVKKQSVIPYLDIASLGFLIGQAIGRWGNFFNREAYGSQTSLPWRMVLGDDGVGYHPCFLYESLWCALGFVLLHFYSKKYRKFSGETVLLYALWYSFERFFIEGLREDSLMIGPIRVSQLFSALVFIAAVVLLLLGYRKVRERREEQGEYTPVYAPAGPAAAVTDGEPVDASIAADEAEEEIVEEPGGMDEPEADAETVETPENDSEAAGDIPDEAPDAEETSEEAPDDSDEAEAH